MNREPTAWILEVRVGDAVVYREQFQAEPAAENAAKERIKIEKRTGRNGAVIVFPK